MCESGESGEPAAKAYRKEQLETRVNIYSTVHNPIYHSYYQTADKITAKVLHGKIPVVEVFIIRPKEYLAIPPIPLPIPTRNVLTKVSEKTIAIFL